MPRGRQFAPSIDRDGVWFRHPDVNGPPQCTERSGITSTGRMLAFALQPNNKTFPIPDGFHSRGLKNYKRSNSFSLHDNRHVFQDNGEYFGDNKSSRLLGKKLYQTEAGHHCTDRHMLKHFDRGVTNFDYCTTNDAASRGQSSTDTPVYRRFPKRHSSDSGPAKPAPTESEWFQHGSESQVIPLHVLATSQAPFPKHNSWRYSNNGLHRVYPSYNINKPYPPPVFNKYGASFITGR